MKPAPGSMLSWRWSVFGGAITPKVWPLFSQQAATSGAERTAEKYLKISAVAFTPVDRNWMNYYKIMPIVLELKKQ